jgi:two-component system sensor histidine kinase ChvG
VIFIFSFVLNRYFLKPIKNLVNYTKIIKEKSKKKTNINELKSRNDELGTLSNSLDDMTHELQKRISHAENFSTDLVHEIRNPLTSLKSATEILHETEDKIQRSKLIDILNHDVQRIERLITDYSQMLKDEVALSKEKMKKINLKLIAKSVVDDFNNTYETKRGIKIFLNEPNTQEEYLINGIENRIEQIIANLLDNSISFTDDNKNILVEIFKNENEKVVLKVIDEGKGFKETSTKKIFDRFYSNRPDTFGEHSGLGLNIVKNLVDLHGATIKASNNIEKKGANVEIAFPKS